MNVTSKTEENPTFVGSPVELPEEIADEPTNEVGMEAEHGNDNFTINDTGVVVDDNNIDQMEEDLLNYDSDNEMAEAYSDDDDRDSNIRQVAKNLLQKPANKVLLTYGNDTFLLYDCQDPDSNGVNGDDSTTAYPIICRNNGINTDPSNILMSTVRHFLEAYYNKIKFTTKEILINFPALDISLCEDNIYNNQISFEDIQTVFQILKSRSEANNESNIPPCLMGNIELRPRFVSRYNTLVELTESTATLKNIRPFSNDESHPVLLDDINADSNEMIVMNIDDESDEDVNIPPGSDVENMKNNVERGSRNLFVTSDPEDTTNNAEDDLLEIVSDKAELN